MALPPNTVVSVRSPPRADRRADELGRDRLGIQMHVIGRHVPDEVLVHVAGDDDGVAEPRCLRTVQHLLTIGGIAVPFLAAERPDRRIGIGVVRGERHLVGQQVPVGGRLPQAVDQPRLLRLALDRPRRIERARAVAVDSLLERAVGRRPVRSILPRVEHVDRQQVCRTASGR